MLSALAFDGLQEVQLRQYVDALGLQPIIKGFGGKTASQSLLNGMNAASACLKKYTATLSYDPTRANELFDKIQVWQDSHGEELKKLSAQGAKTVPQQIALTLGPEQAKHFVVASFSEAARGLSGWVGGAVAANYKTNPNFTQSMAIADQESRLITFATIVKLDRDGTLAAMFAKPGTSGLGVLGIDDLVVAGIIIGVAAIIAVTVIVSQSMSQSYMNEKIDQLCKLDESKCKEVIADVIKKKAEQSPVSAITESIGTVGKVAAVGLVGYLAFTLGLPMLKRKAS